MRGEIDRRAISSLSAGHFATDFANGALPALLPFLVGRFDLNYTQVGALVLVSALASSIIQPLFGLWSGPPRRRLAPARPACSSPASGWR